MGQGGHNRTVPYGPPFKNEQVCCAPKKSDQKSNDWEIGSNLLVYLSMDLGF